MHFKQEKTNINMAAHSLNRLGAQDKLLVPPQDLFSPENALKLKPAFSIAELRILYYSLRIVMK